MQNRSFEDFFIGSVEFCKLKFDNDDSKRDNRKGTQGPPGQAEVTGSTGPQGPQGTQGILGPSWLSKSIKLLFC